MGITSKLWLHTKMLRFDRLSFNEKTPPEFSFAHRWTPDPNHFRSFLDISPGWQHPSILSPTYPQVALAELHAQILADRRFPFNPIGVVHFRNYIKVHRPISVEENISFDVQISLENWTPHRRGYTFDICTTLFLQDNIIWESIATVLVKRNQPSSKKEHSTESTSTPNDDRMHLPENLGRRYARIAGDFNPIHQHAWLAKPFGFSRAIVHGMWVLAWSIHEPLSQKTPDCLECTGVFTRPLPLPCDIWREIIPKNNGFDINIYNIDPPKACLELSLLL